MPEAVTLARAPALRSSHAFSLKLRMLALVGMVAMIGSPLLLVGSQAYLEQASAYFRKDKDIVLVCSNFLEAIVDRKDFRSYLASGARVDSDVWASLGFPVGENITERLKFNLGPSQRDGDQATISFQIALKDNAPVSDSRKTSLAPTEGEIPSKVAQKTLLNPPGVFSQAQLDAYLKLRGVLHLANIQGAWRIRAVDLTTPGRAPVSVPLEANMDVLSRGPSELERQANFRIFESLKPISLEQGVKKWQITQTFEKQTGRSILHDLAARLDLQLATPEMIFQTATLTRRLNSEVTLAFSNTSLVEALDVTAQKLGLRLTHAGWPNSAGIPSNKLPAQGTLTATMIEGPLDSSGMLQKGGLQYQLPPLITRDNSDRQHAAYLGANATCYTGPFAVVAMEIQESVPQGVGALRLGIHAPVLPPVLALLLQQRKVDVQILSVRGDDGSDLYQAQQPRFVQETDPKSGLGVNPLFLLDSYERSYSVPLYRLFAHLERIQSLRGRLWMPVPDAITELRLEDLTPKKGKSADGAAITFLERRVKGIRIVNGQAVAIDVFSFSQEGIGADPIVWAAFNQQGENIEVGELLAAPATFEINTARDTASVCFKIVRSTKSANFDFELKDLPLLIHPPRSAKLELPRGVTTPLTLHPSVGSHTSFTSPAAKPVTNNLSVRVKSMVAKAVEKLELKFEYWNDRDQKIGQAVLSYQMKPNKDIPFGIEPDLPPWGNATLFFNDPKQPKATKRVRCTIQKIFFRDGTTWQPEKAEQHAPEFVPFQ